MKKYKVVISPGIEFYLDSLNFIQLRELGCSWACNYENGESEKFCSQPRLWSRDDAERNNRKFTPSLDELPRHDKALIELAATIKRFEVVELEVKVWPPKYFVLNTGPLDGEELFEPCTVPWKTVYYPEEYDAIEDVSEEEQQLAKIRAIAP